MKISCGDYKINKQNFQASKKLTHRPSHRMNSTDRVSGRERPFDLGWLQFLNRKSHCFRWN